MYDIYYSCGIKNMMLLDDMMLFTGKLTFPQDLNILACLLNIQFTRPMQDDAIFIEQ